jgi:hypothetical protein
MEAISLGIGIAGLAGLFSACVDCFDLVQRGRYLGKEYLLLETKYTNQRLRLLAWGRACGFLDKSGYDPGLEDDEVQKCIQDNLVHIFNLLNNGKRLMTRYGLKEERQTSQALSVASSALETLIPWKSVPGTAFGRKLQDFRDRAKSTQKQAKLSGSARWAIDDRRKFMELVQHLKDLIDDLESVTTSLGISRKYRELVRHEVEIFDIPTLETMEEARWGADDEISDAASHRLWVLRDQYDKPEKALLTADTTTRQKDDDWEEVPSFGAATSSPPQETIYQTLHRVTCSLQPLTVFFDQPTHQVYGQNENQWVYLDNRRKTSHTTSIHLSGARAVPDLEAYLAQNSAVQFVLFKDYTCCHDSDQRESAELQSNQQQSVYLASAGLCSALNYCFEEITLSTGAPAKLSDIAPSVCVGLELQYPWAWFYHCQYEIHDKVRDLIRADDLDGSGQSPLLCGRLKKHDAKSILVLLDKILEISHTSFSRFKDLCKGSTTKWEFLPFIFIPWEPLVANQNKHKDHYQLYSLKHFPKFHAPSTASGYIELTVQYYKWGRSFTEPTLQTFTIHRNQFGKTGDSEVPIIDLVTHPLGYSTSIKFYDITLRARIFWDVGPGKGTHFKELSDSETLKKADIGNELVAWSKAPAHVVSYFGSTADGTDDITKRTFVIDIMNYDRLRDNSDSDHWRPNLQRIKQLGKTDAEYDFQTYIRDGGVICGDFCHYLCNYDELPDKANAIGAGHYDISGYAPEVGINGDPTLLLPPTIMGFDMEDHQWKELRVENLRHVWWRRKAIDDLVMDERKKEVLLSFFNKPTISRLVLLFHGNPGTGKSFAVEALAEYAKKAVYKLNLADIGMTASDIETHLRKAITLTNAWGCILLIEDIGSLFRKPVSGDFQRHSKLSAFVRLIDELQGVLILTSREGPSNLDNALNSRIHHIVRFGLNQADHEQRTRMWKRQLKSMLSTDDYSNIHDIERLGTINLQGWEIHNAISTAQQIAASRDKPVDFATLVLAVENLTGRGPLQDHG